MGHFRLLAWTGLSVIAAAALIHNATGLAPGMFDWAEPGNVAAALVQGRGFSDPFDGGTGPTAWVSPLPVWVEAAVFLVFGVKTAAAAKALLAYCALLPSGPLEVLSEAWLDILISVALLWAALETGRTPRGRGPLVLF